MKILGIDPGYAIMGYGIVEMKGNHFSVCCHGAITTCAGTEMSLRLKYLYESLTEIIKEHKPEEYEILLSWFEEAKQYNGFYILGV